jgi:hypothetical protein
MPRNKHSEPNGHRRRWDSAALLTTTPTEDETCDPDPVADASGAQISTSPRRPNPSAKVASRTRPRACREIVTARD